MPVNTAFAVPLLFLIRSILILNGGTFVYMLDDPYIHLAVGDRFLTGWWKRPIAVNNLGWARYRNEEPILDLWGLASLDALRARTPWRGSQWMNRITPEKNVGLAIIHREWIQSVPSDWTLVAEMHLRGPRTSCGGDKVTFHAISSEARDLLPDMLRGFSATLPHGVILKIDDIVEKIEVD